MPSSLQLQFPQIQLERVSFQGLKCYNSVGLCLAFSLHVACLHQLRDFVLQENTNHLSNKSLPNGSSAQL